MALQDALEDIANVAEQVPAIGDLHGVGCAAPRAVGVALRAIAADDLDARMRGEPRREVIGRAVCEQIDDRVALEIDEHDTVGLTAPPSPVVDAEHARRRRRWHRRAVDQPQRRVAAPGALIPTCADDPSTSIGDPTTRSKRSTRTTVRSKIPLSSRGCRRCG